MDGYDRLKKLLNCVPKWLYSFIFLTVMYSCKTSSSFPFLPTFGIGSPLICSHSNRYKVFSQCGLNVHFSIVEHILVCIFATV